jgi:hypothetical protein
MGGRNHEWGEEPRMGGRNHEWGGGTTNGKYRIRGSVVHLVIHLAAWLCDGCMGFGVVSGTNMTYPEFNESGD